MVIKAVACYSEHKQANRGQMDKTQKYSNPDSKRKFAGALNEELLETFYNELEIYQD